MASSYVGRVPRLISCCSVWVKTDMLTRQGRYLHQLSLRPKSHITNEEVDTGMVHFFEGFCAFLFFFNCIAFYYP